MFTNTCVSRSLSLISSLSLVGTFVSLSLVRAPLARTHALTHVSTRTHARTDVHTHTHTYTHTHTDYTHPTYKCSPRELSMLSGAHTDNTAHTTRVTHPQMSNGQIMPRLPSRSPSLSTKQQNQCTVKAPYTLLSFFLFCF